MKEQLDQGKISEENYIKDMNQKMKIEYAQLLLKKNRSRKEKYVSAKSQVYDKIEEEAMNLIEDIDGMNEGYMDASLAIKKAIYDKAVASGFVNFIMDPEAKRKFIERGRDDYEGDDKYMVDFEEVFKTQAQARKELIEKKKKEYFDKVEGEY